MSIVEIKRTLEGHYSLYIRGELLGTYRTLTKATNKAYKYTKGQSL